jgi:hypothetical protein
MKLQVAACVMAGLDPAIPIVPAQRCHMNRDARDKRGHDGLEWSL